MTATLSFADRLTESPVYQNFRDHPFFQAVDSADLTKEQAASQRDISDYGTKVNFWQWSPRREKYQEIWNEVKAAK